MSKNALELKRKEPLRKLELLSSCVLKRKPVKPKSYGYKKKLVFKRSRDSNKRDRLRSLELRHSNSSVLSRKDSENLKYKKKTVKLS